ncbi:MAG: YdaU family protein [Pseudomonadota bacterium]
MTARWYKRCGADFIHGTMMLTLEEKGAYSLCLDLIYDRGGPIPDDARWLSGVCGVSIRKWNAIRERLLSLGKLAAGHGMLSNARADVELVSAALSARERAESGAKGGRKRAENAAPPKENNGLDQAELKREEKRREEEKEVEASASTARAKPRLLPASMILWNEVAKVKRWPLATAYSDARRKSLTQRLAEHGDDGWRAALNRAASSPYLGGSPPPTFFTFDWLLSPTNFLKVIEGNYDRQRNNGMGRDQPDDGIGPTARSAVAAFPDVFGPDARHPAGTGH